MPAAAQKVQVFGGQGQRAATSLVLFGENIMAGITITCGQPEWRDEYNAMLDRLEGKMNRLGKDLWTTYLASVPVEIGGVLVPAGSYVAGLHCDQDGTFALALLGADRAMKDGRQPFGPQNWQPDVRVPLQLNKNVAAEPVAAMTMTLAVDREDPMNGTFTLAWGPHTLTAPIAIQVR